jgi:O-antigen/teichoic acid export membrane protein
VETALIADRFRVSSTLRGIITNTGWLFGLKILRILFSLFLAAWVARYLGTERYGVLQYSVAFVALFSPLAILGLQGIVVRDIVRAPEERDEILGTTFILRLAGGLTGFVLVLFLIYAVRKDDPLVRLVTGVTALTLFLQAFDTIDMWFQSQVKSKYTVIAKSVALTVANLVRIAAILMGAPVTIFAVTLVVDVIISGWGLVTAYRSQGHRLRSWRFSIARAKNLLGQSWTLVLSGALAIIYFKIDQVMLGEMSGESEVGVYATAARISEIWYFIPTAIATSVFPTLIKAKSRGEGIYYARLQQLYDFLAGLGLAVAVFFTFTSDRLIVIVFGEQYAAAGPILSVHIWAGVFIFLKVALNRWLLNEGRLKFLFISSSLGAAVNVALNLFLIPRHGGMGAAVATVISYAMASLFACFFYRPAWGNGWMMTKALFVPLRSLAHLAGRIGGGTSGKGGSGEGDDRN